MQNEAEIINRPFAYLDDHDYMSLATRRKDGTVVQTPVWFAEIEGDLYVTTYKNSGKVKRLSHTPQVTINPCDRKGFPLGPQIEAFAEVVEDENIRQQAWDALKEKYSPKADWGNITSRLEMDERAFIRVKAAE